MCTEEKGTMCNQYRRVSTRMFWTLLLPLADTAAFWQPLNVLYYAKGIQQHIKTISVLAHDDIERL